MKTRSHRLMLIVTSVALTASLPAHAVDDAMIASQPAGNRVYYQGPQPQVTPPPAYAADAPLPFVYCDQARQWVVLYPDRNGTQYYALDPQRRDSYKAVIQAAAQGKRAPWALRVSLQGVPTYFVNVDPENKQTFDYVAPAAGFDICRELAELPVVRQMVQGDPKLARSDEKN